MRKNPIALVAATALVTAGLYGCATTTQPADGDMITPSAIITDMPGTGSPMPSATGDQ